MTFGENRDGSGGGFTVSFTTVANAIAGAALLSVCGVLLTDHSDIVSVKDAAAQCHTDIASLYAENSARRNDASDLRATIQELKGAKIARDGAMLEIERRFERIEKQEADLDLLLRPPRTR